MSGKDLLECIDGGLCGDVFRDSLSLAVQLDGRHLLRPARSITTSGHTAGCTPTLFEFPSSQFCRACNRASAGANAISEDSQIPCASIAKPAAQQEARQRSTESPQMEFLIGD